MASTAFWQWLPKPEFLLMTNAIADRINSRPLPLLMPPHEPVRAVLDNLFHISE
jgi:hypothetical protein